MNNMRCEAEMLYEKIKKSVVMISTCPEKKGQYKKISNGVTVVQSGFIITSARAVLNYHNSRLAVFCQNAGFISFVEAFSKQKEKDNVGLALVCVAGQGSDREISFAENSKCSVGQKMFCFSFDEKESLIIKEGKILNDNLIADGLSYPLLSVESDIGDTDLGGPIVNENGELLGVITEKAEHGSNVYYAVPAEIVKEFVITIIERSMISEEDTDGIAKYLKFDRKLPRHTGALKNIKISDIPDEK